MEQRIIAFANQKGGVGKTTTVINLAAALALKGKRVCLVDMDPQANATVGLGINSDELDLSVYDLMLEDVPLKNVIKKINDNLFVIPSSIGLAGAEVKLPTLAGKDMRLKKALEQAKDFDYILIDAPPSLSQLTLNALTAAKEVIVTLQVQFYSYRGLAELIKTIDMVKQYTNPDLIMSGIVCTFYREQRTLNKSIDDMLRDQFGETVFKTKIRENIKLAETPSVGMDIFSYDPNSLGAQDYSALCKEVIDMEEAKRG